MSRTALFTTAALCIATAGAWTPSSLATRDARPRRIIRVRAFDPDPDGLRYKAADDVKLTRPGMMPWMFDDEGNLAEDQVTFDWKAVNYRADQLGGHDPNLQEGDIDDAELGYIQPMLDVFVDTVEVLEAANGVFRFKYYGMVKNQIGMEAWGRSLIIENHPDPDTVKEVSFLTNLKRDSFLGDKC